MFNLSRGDDWSFGLGWSLNEVFGSWLGVWRSNPGGSDGARAVARPLPAVWSLGDWVPRAGAAWALVLAWAWRVSTSFKLSVILRSSAAKEGTFGGPAGWWDCC